MVEEEENGFWFEPAEVEEVEPKRLSPKFGAGFCGFGVFRGSVVFAVVLGFLAEAFETLIPLIALKVPSFFRHAFRLQLKI